MTIGLESKSLNRNPEKMQMCGKQKRGCCFAEGFGYLIFILFLCKEMTEERDFYKRPCIDEIGQEERMQKAIEGRAQGMRLISCGGTGESLHSPEAGVLVSVPNHKGKGRVWSLRKPLLTALGCFRRRKWRQRTKLRMPEGDRREGRDRSLQKSHPGKQAEEGTNRKVWLSGSTRPMWESDNYFKVRPLNLWPVK